MFVKNKIKLSVEVSKNYMIKNHLNKEKIYSNKNKINKK